MTQILIVTVGGSYEPILQSIESNAPDFVYFLCSNDIGKTKGSYTQVNAEGNIFKSSMSATKNDLPNIVTQAGLDDTEYEIILIDRIDDLRNCHGVATEAMKKARGKFNNPLVSADYTGGTKTMTAGLVAAALDDEECRLSIMTGLRNDLKRVVSQTALSKQVPAGSLRLRRRNRMAEELIQRFDYSAAQGVLEEASRLCRDSERFQKMTEFVTICRAFDAWDRFNHDQAMVLLSSLPKQICVKQRAFLGVMQKKAGHGFELVEDLLLNVERRATQHRFDDAAARLYRAIEMTSQIWLQQKYGLDSSNIDVNKIPEKATTSFSCETEGPIKISLMQGWELLASISGDVVGQQFSTFKSEMLSFLSVRNRSLLAHGTTPVNRRVFRLHHKKIVGFIDSVIDVASENLGRPSRAQALQFPTSLDD